jgi:hypothetical protein
VACFKPLIFVLLLILPTEGFAACGWRFYSPEEIAALPSEAFASRVPRVLKKYVVDFPTDLDHQAHLTVLATILKKEDALELQEYLLDLASMQKYSWVSEKLYQDRVKEFSFDHPFEIQALQFGLISSQASRILVFWFKFHNDLPGLKAFAKKLLAAVPKAARSGDYAVPAKLLSATMAFSPADIPFSFKKEVMEIYRPDPFFKEVCSLEHITQPDQLEVCRVAFDSIHSWSRHLSAPRASLTSEEAATAVRSFLDGMQMLESWANAFLRIHQAHLEGARGRRSFVRDDLRYEVASWMEGAEKLIQQYGQESDKSALEEFKEKLQLKGLLSIQW